MRLVRGGLVRHYEGCTGSTDCLMRGGETTDSQMSRLGWQSAMVLLCSNESNDGTNGATDRAVAVVIVVVQEGGCLDRCKSLCRLNRGIQIDWKHLIQRKPAQRPTWLLPPQILLVRFDVSVSTTHNRCTYLQYNSNNLLPTPRRLT